MFTKFQKTMMRLLRNKTAEIDNKTGRIIIKKNKKLEEIFLIDGIRGMHSEIKEIFMQKN